MTRSSISRLAIAPLCFASIATTSEAQPQAIAYQGELQASGTLFDGTAYMKFAIVADGVILWSNSPLDPDEPADAHAVPVDDGRFSVLLGEPAMPPLSATTLAGSASTALRVWVGQTQDGEFEQLSDQPISSVPFALSCETSAGSGVGDGVWSVNEPDIYRTEGNVGIGTDAPGARLHVVDAVDGIARFTDSIEGNELLIGTDSDYRDYIRLRATSGKGVAITNDGDDIGIFVSATNARVGVGTSDPSARLHVVGHGGELLRLRDSQNFNALNIGTDDDRPGYIRLRPTQGSGVAITGDSNAVGVFVRASNAKVGIGTSEPESRLHVAGTTRTEILKITGGMDLAEPFDVSGSAPPGCVVVIDDAQPGALVQSQRPYDKRVAGIVSGAGGIQPGITLTQTPDAIGQSLVALSGRVYVKADATHEPIRPGDLLTTSSRPGHAMAASDAMRASGATIGKAMSALDSGTGLVLVLVSLQ